MDSTLIVPMRALHSTRCVVAQVKFRDVAFVEQLFGDFSALYKLEKACEHELQANDFCIFKRRLGTTSFYYMSNL